MENKKEYKYFSLDGKTNVNLPMDQVVKINFPILVAGEEVKKEQGEIDYGKVPKKVDFDATKSVFQIVREGEVILETTTKSYQQANVLMLIVQAQLAKDKKNLHNPKEFDDAVKKMNIFLEVERRNRTYSHEEVEVTLNTALIKAIIGTAMGGGTIMELLTEVLNVMGDQIKFGWKIQSDDQEIGTLVFFIEQMANMPMISVQYFKAKISKKEEENYSNCHSFHKTKFSFDYEQIIYRYIPPSWILALSTEDLQNMAKIEELRKSIFG